MREREREREREHLSLTKWSYEDDVMLSRIDGLKDCFRKGVVLKFFKKETLKNAKIDPFIPRQRIISYHMLSRPDTRQLKSGAGR